MKFLRKSSNNSLFEGRVRSNKIKFLRTSNKKNNSSLGEIGIHDRLKICSFFWGIGSSPIVSKIISGLIFS